jgi:hypothetical protein
MSCYCDYDGLPSFHSEAFRTARKVHRCCECGADILPGSVYQYVSGSWDGDFLTFKSCEPCADLRDALSEVGCPSYGDLYEFYRVYLDETGKVRYDEERDEYIYPENHLIDSEGDIQRNRLRRAA